MNDDFTCAESDPNPVNPILARCEFNNDASIGHSRAGKRRFTSVIGVFTGTECDADAVNRDFAVAKSGSRVVIALSKRRKSAVTNAE